MSITTEQIIALSSEAAVAGDLEMVAVCQRSLDGDSEAIAECDRVIADAAAMVDDSYFVGSVEQLVMVGAMEKA